MSELRMFAVILLIILQGFPLHADNTKEFINKTPSPISSPSGGEGYTISPPLRGGDKGEGGDNFPEVIHEATGANVAEEVRQVYPSVVRELTETLQWGVDFRPKIVLANNQDTFRKIAGKDIIVAFAVPGKNLIVLDVSRVYAKPFTLESTLKHELCHLVLHRNIQKGLLPRWVDEGVCQWASGGIGELMADDGGRVLSKAVMSGNLINLRELERFPLDDPSLVLAYEESKSFIEYLVREHGTRGLLQMLAHLKAGNTIHESVEKGLSMTLAELESDWRAGLTRKYTWFTYLSSNLYTILFSLAALVTFFGFIRLLKRKREYRDEEEENEKQFGE